MSEVRHLPGTPADTPPKYRIRRHETWAMNGDAEVPGSRKVAWVVYRLPYFWVVGTVSPPTAANWPKAIEIAAKAAKAWNAQKRRAAQASR